MKVFLREGERQGGVHVLLQGRPLQWVDQAGGRPAPHARPPSPHPLAVIQEDEAQQEFCVCKIYRVQSTYTTIKISLHKSTLAMY